MITKHGFRFVLVAALRAELGLLLFFSQVTAARTKLGAGGQVFPAAGALTENKLLVAASLEIKKVRRYPGMILSRTYNLKNRPIVIL